MTSKRNGTRHAARALLGLAVLGLTVTQARAADVWLRAGTTTKTLPGAAAPTEMWGYALCGASFAGCGDVTVPGPELAIGAAETGLTIHLANDLPEPTSIVIPGQTATLTPVWIEPGSTTTWSGKRPDGNVTARVRSFTHEAPPGGTAVYDFPALRPGTYLYESGTHPQIQVQMGLYGAMVQNAVDAAMPARAQAYPGVEYEYDRAVTVVYGEIDPALHHAVATGAYGSSGPTSTFDYQPKYFLVNEAPFDAGTPPLATVGGGERVLLRFVNAGLRNHVPMILGGHMELLAEDGQPYPWPSHPREQYTVLLPAAKTADALVTPVNVGPGDARLAILDRRLDVTNAGQPDGGLVAFLAVTPGPAAPVIPSAPVTTAAVGAPYAYQAVAADPNPGDTQAWSLDVAPADMTISAAGLVEWTPTLGGTYPVTVRVTDSAGLFATQSFSIAVSDGDVAPTITSTPDLAATEDVPWTYQATATDPNPGDTQTWSLDVAPAGMAISAAGLVAWTPTNAQAITNGGANPVTVRVTDSGGLFATQAFTVTVANVNDAPVAVADGPYPWVEGGTLSVAAPGVLANDSDPDGDPLVAVAFSAPSAGSLSGGATGGFTWALPMGSVGTRTFTYQARDPSLATSGAATVTVQVQANRPPTAAADTFSAPRRTTQNAGAFPVVLNVLANDSDPDTAIDPTNRIDPATVAIAAAPNKGGTVSVDANGAISYTPKLNFKGTDTFSYTVRDNRGTPGALSNAATVRVNVQ
jgi:Big-like domain-containing protein/cadherin-like protein/putative Ig domain-containing protein/multicopper oxidase